MGDAYADAFGGLEARVDRFDNRTIIIVFASRISEGETLRHVADEFEAGKDNLVPACTPGDEHIIAFEDMEPVVVATLAFQFIPQFAKGADLSRHDLKACLGIRKRCCSGSHPFNWENMRRIEEADAGIALDIFCPVTVAKRMCANAGGTHYDHKGRDAQEHWTTEFNAPDET